MIGNYREDVFSVTEVTRLVKGILERNIPNLWIEGEVANYTVHSSGHIYFSMKDAKSSIKCVYFRQHNLKSTFHPENGEKILCYGSLDVYEKAGSYQLLVTDMIQMGVGELHVRFLALKNRLQEEGLFRPEIKKKLPSYPERIGIVSSPTGAAFQDIKNVIARRYPCILILYPAAVQGDNAPKELISGLQFFNQKQSVDLIIIGRGGGSQEDLFCFNDENLAREIRKSEIPIISAVGHEIDFTISDFVADLRAPTPSAAAELAVPDKAEITKKVVTSAKQLTNLTFKEVSKLRNAIVRCERALLIQHPREQLYRYQQRIDDAESKLREKINTFRNFEQLINLFKEKLQRAVELKASRRLNNSFHDLELRLNRLILSANSALTEKRGLISNNEKKLQTYSPYEAMKRGYAIIKQNEKLVFSVKKANTDSTIEVVLQDGLLICNILQIKNKVLS